MSSSSAVERLRAEGILAHDAVLSPQDEAALNSLTPDEVEAIISIRNKLGTDFISRHAVPRADFIF